MKSFVSVLALLLAAGADPAVAADKRPMKVEDLFRFKRVSDPQISPDGKLVAYVVGSVSQEHNSIASCIWIAPTDGKGKPRQLTNTSKKDGHPPWSPDGKYLLFESNRSGSGQLWVIALDGGE